MAGGLNGQQLEELDVRELFGASAQLDDAFTALALAQLSVERLRHARLDEVPASEFVAFTAGVEQLRNQVEASVVAAAQVAEDAGHGRDDGYFSTRAWVRHHANLSAGEARIRTQVMRMFAAVPGWERAARNGVVGVEQVRLLARTFARSAVREAVVAHSDELLVDAIELPFDTFAEHVANLRRLADSEGECQAAQQQQHDRRDLTMRRLRDGSWRLWGRFGGMQGAEINHILAHFNDAEFRADWEAAKAEVVGSEAVSFDSLERHEPQRRADALLRALRAACGPHAADGQLNVPTLNVLIDAETLESTVLGGEHDPARFRNVVCRTQDGQPLEFNEAANTALFGEIRRVVLDAAGVVINLGRRRRLFTGGVREAVLLTATTCIWFGCDAPVRRAQADHNVEWQHLGATEPENGGATCGRHNPFKSQHGFRVHRTTDGEFVITDRNGRSIG